MTVKIIGRALLRTWRVATKSGHQMEDLQKGLEAIQPPTAEFARATRTASEGFGGFNLCGLQCRTGGK